MYKGETKTKNIMSTPSTLKELNHTSLALTTYRGTAEATNRISTPSTLKESNNLSSITVTSRAENYKNTCKNAAPGTRADDTKRMI